MVGLVTPSLAAAVPSGIVIGTLVAIWGVPGLALDKISLFAVALVAFLAKSLPPVPTCVPNVRVSSPVKA